MNRSFFETIVGALVLFVAVGFMVYAFRSSGVQTVTGYTVSARFNKVDGLTMGSDVRLGGIKIGSVTGQDIDTATYQAIIAMNLREDIKLPKDSGFAVSSDGLLGGKYISVEPGNEEAQLADGDQTSNTQPSVSIEELIGKMVFSGGGVDGGVTGGGSDSDSKSSGTGSGLLD
jgi:phospholipid/cholesterol/gamma-HCH transport system substrate-binding protein